MQLTQGAPGESSPTETRSELDAGARLAALQAVASGLAGCTSPAAVADVIVTRGSTVLGGQTGSLCLLLDDGETLELVREIGYHPEVEERFHHFPLAAPLPACDALRTGEPLVLRSLAERDARYPHLAGLPTTNESFVVLPLIYDTNPLGVFSIGFAAPRDFSPDEVGFLQSLADLCAQALDRARLFAETVAARIEAERASERLAFLAEATATVGASLDPDATLAATARLAVPRLADMCAVLVIDDDTDELRPVAVEHTEPDRAAHLQAAIEELPARAATSAVARIIREGEPRWFPTVTPDLLRQATTSDRELGLLEQLDIASGAIVPLVARNRVAGALILGSRPGRSPAREDESLARELAARAAVAVDNARLYRERAMVAATLQQTLLPPRLPGIPGVDLSPMYAAAGQGDVGGDFYDAFEAADGQWLLVIGDVRGKGVDAARLTSLVHHSIRSLSLRAHTPALILRQLNQVLAHAADDADVEPRFCTVLILALRPAAGGLEGTIARAGHPLPVVARADGPMEVAGGAGDLLGVMADVEIEDTPIRLHRGDVMVMFTDGIVERHAGADFFGEAGICSVLDSTRGLDAAAIAARLEAAVTGFAPRSPRDDMAALVVRVTG